MRPRSQSGVGALPLDASRRQAEHVLAMRALPNTQFRKPLFSRAAFFSSLLAGASAVTFLASSEQQGALRIAGMGFALALGLLGVRLAWRVK